MNSDWITCTVVESRHCFIKLLALLDGVPEEVAKEHFINELGDDNKLEDP